ncbi:MAG: hypothetical protein OHK0026_08630 [Rhodocyclaceae bacterium]
MSNRDRPALSRLACALVLAGCMSVPAAHALDVTWITAGAGNWTDAANWNPALPGAGDRIFITADGAAVSFDSAAGLTYDGLNLGAATPASLSQSANTLGFMGDAILGSSVGQTGSYDLSGTGSLTAHHEYVGLVGTGTFTQTGGTHGVTLSLILGYVAGATGSYDLSGTGSLTAGNETVGLIGTGTFTQTSGTHGVTGDLALGDSAGATGSYDLSGAGSLTVGGSEYVGYVGTGTFTQTGGAHGVTGDLALGHSAGATGSYSLSGSGSLAVGGNEIVGRAGRGTFNQLAGTHTVAGNLYVDITVASKGEFNLSGGTLDVAGDSLIGNNGFASGTFNHDGGSHTVSKNLVLGTVADSTGYYYLSGSGSLTVLTSTVIGAEGSGSFTQDGGTFDQYGGYGALVLGSAATGSGTYTLNGGVLDVQGDEEYIADSGTGTFYQYGGEHRVSGAMYIGTSSSGYGEYHMAGGIITNARVDGGGNPLYAGLVLGEWAGTGKFFHSDGTVNVDSVTLARQAGSNGYYEMNGAGAVLNTNSMNVGQRATGSFVHSDGTVNVAAGLDIGGDAGASGSYELHGGSLNTSGPVVVGNAGSGTFTQTGGTHDNAGGIVLGAGTGSLGTYDLQGGTLNSPGNPLTVGGAVLGSGAGGHGQFFYSGGNFNANLHNYGFVEFSGPGTRVVNGDVTNDAGATMIAHATQVQFTGTFFNAGAYVSDPSINTFADVIVTESGYLVGGPGDHFLIAGAFWSSSIQNTLWFTQNSQLIFTGDTSHEFWITGADLGPTTAGYSHNFGWGDFQLDGEVIYLVEGNAANPGGALYVGTIQGLVILDGDTIGNLHGNRLNVYYDPVSNAYLGGKTYALADGGTLAPVPEPATWAMLLAGLGLLAVKRRS